MPVWPRKASKRFVRLFLMRFLVGEMCAFLSSDFGLMRKASYGPRRLPQGHQQSCKALNSLIRPPKAWPCPPGLPSVSSLGSLPMHHAAFRRHVPRNPRAAYEAQWLHRILKGLLGGTASTLHPPIHAFIRSSMHSCFHLCIHAVIHLLKKGRHKPMRRSANVRSARQKCVRQKCDQSLLHGMVSLAQVICSLPTLPKFPPLVYDSAHRTSFLLLPP